MRRSEREITESTVIEEILAGAGICRIAMIDGNLPYLLPFNYGYRDNVIYIHCAPEGRKINILKKNKTVCFEIEDVAKLIRDEVACNWTTAYRSLVGYGTVEIITDPGKKHEGLNIIMNHYGAAGSHNFNKNKTDSLVILKLTITSVTGKQSGNWQG